MSYNTDWILSSYTNRGDSSSLDSLEGILYSFKPKQIIRILPTKTTNKRIQFTITKTCSSKVQKFRWNFWNQDNTYIHTSKTNTTILNYQNPTSHVCVTKNETQRSFSFFRKSIFMFKDFVWATITVSLICSIQSMDWIATMCAYIKLVNSKLVLISCNKHRILKTLAIYN